MTIPVYPDEEAAELALEMRDRRIDSEVYLSGWHMEGKMSLFDLKKDSSLLKLTG